MLLDTNVAFNNPEVLDIERQIRDNYIPAITSHVLREIEHLELTRKQDRTLQFQIRRFKRLLDESEHTHVDIKDYEFNLRDDWDGKYTDNILIQICVENGWGMITNDRLLKEKAKLYNIEVMNVKSQNYTPHKGFQEFFVSETQHRKSMESSEVNTYDLLLNEYGVVNNVVDGELLDIIRWDGLETLTLKDAMGKLGSGFKTLQFNEFLPRDEYQAMAVDSVFKNVITCIRGRAGSGKSLIALSTSLYLMEKEQYKLVIFANPVKTKDSEELGYYKGDMFEKLMQSSLGAMLKSKFGDAETVKMYMMTGKIDILPFSDLRGYDTGETKVIIWIAEAQNLTAELLKLGIQRAAINTKIIVDGDYDLQIDKDIFIADSGMKRMSEVFRGTQYYGEVELMNVHRNPIGELAELM